MTIDSEQFENLLAIAESETPEIEKSDFILLHEWTDLIAKTYKRASDAEQTLNELYQIAQIKSLKQLDEVRHEHGNKTWLAAQMFKDKKVKELSQFVAIENMIIPEPLKRAALLLEKDIDLSFLEFNESNEWEINLELLEDYCDKQYRTFATTAEQLEKYYLLKALTDFLNSEISIGENTAHSFYSILIDRDGTGFIPNRKFVLADNEKDFLN